ncbi:MAG TPA: hydroxysqualene dehydroxylase HpnE, partial [Actinomycetota bacterium]|nr:hydroxysqualene dehydroxylase HpnE [Actinomycetota bacterium]
GHLPPVDRLRAMRAAAALARSPRLEQADDRTFQDWLQERGQRPTAVRTLWNLIALPALNLPADQAALGPAAKVFRTGLLLDRAAGDVGYAVAPLARVHGEPAARALEAAGAEVRVKTAVRSIELQSGLLRVHADGTAWDSEAVILAAPHEAAADLLPDGAIPGVSRLSELGSSPIVNLHVVYDRPVMDLPFAAAVDSPVQWVFDRSKTSGLVEGQYLAVSLSGAAAEIDEPTGRLRERYLPALSALFPRVRAARILDFFVTRERRATFRAAPGSAALRPPTRTDVPGLFLAGAWTATGWPATMEGAVRSGEAAATAARDALRNRPVVAA